MADSSIEKSLRRTTGIQEAFEGGFATPENAKPGQRGAKVDVKQPPESLAIEPAPTSNEQHSHNEDAGTNGDVRLSNL